MSLKQRVEELERKVGQLEVAFAALAQEKLREDVYGGHIRALSKLTTRLQEIPTFKTRIKWGKRR